MISNLLLIAGIALWGYVLIDILKIKECFGPVLSIAISMAVLEIGGAFGLLWPTASLYCIAVCILSVAYIVRTRKNAGLEGSMIINRKTYFQNPSIIGFLFAALLYIGLSSGETLFYTKLDSFLHWGMFSKAVFYNHTLDVWSSNLDVNHNVYPHGMASWYSLFALGKRIYAERDVMLSINVLLFASSCPIVDIAACRIRELLPNRKSISVVIYAVSGISVASFLWIWRFWDTCSYTSGYMDIPLGVAFMASLCLAVTDGADYYRKAFGVSILSAMLVMIKPSGIIFVGVVFLVYLANEYIRNGIHVASDGAGKLFRGGMLTIAIPLIELGIWNAMMKYLDITGGDQFRLKEFLPGRVIAKYQSDSAYAEIFLTVVRNFFTAFCTREVVCRISALGWMVLCIVIAVFTIVFQKDQREKKKVLCVNLCMLLAFCLYNLFLLWTYLTTMSENEAVRIACYDRYIGSYIMGWFVLCIYLLFFYHVGSLKVRYLYLGGFFLCNLLGFLNRDTYLKEIDSEIKDMYELSGNIQECISEITYDDSADMPDLWISYADKEESLSRAQITELTYYLFPDFDLINIYGVQEDYDREMKDIIAEFEFDYIVLYGVNEDFHDAYYWFFTDGLSNAREQYENGKHQVYRVIRDEITNEFCWFEPM